MMVYFNDPDTGKNRTHALIQYADLLPASDQGPDLNDRLASGHVGKCWLAHISDDTSARHAYKRLLSKYHSPIAQP